MSYLLVTMVVSPLLFSKGGKRLNHLWSVDAVVQIREVIPLFAAHFSQFIIRINSLKLLGNPIHQKGKKRLKFMFLWERLVSSGKQHHDPQQVSFRSFLLMAR